jgi:hypothetical protein
MEQKPKQGIATQTHDDFRKKLQIENEILRMKLQAEAGAVIGLQDDIPPELENLFLQNVLAFEEASQNVKMVSLYEYLGRPHYRKLDELRPEEVAEELNRLRELIHQKQVHLDILDEYEPAVIYKFIIEELFQQQTYESLLPGMIRHFTYEAFHPNHKIEICERALDFVGDWFERKMDEHSWELNAEFVLPDGRTMKRDEVVQKIKSIFASYKTFSKCQYSMGEVNYEWNEKQNKGLACVEGAVKYLGVVADGEVVPIEGPFKLYLSNEGSWWGIFYFIFPGFTWQDEQQ